MASIGFEATTIYSEEAKNPKRSIPIAAYAELLLVTGFCSVSLWCPVLGAGSDRVVPTIVGLADPTNLLSDTCAGHGLTILLRLIFIASIDAGLIAILNSSALYFYAMASKA